jgi:hypothetical protein
LKLLILSGLFPDYRLGLGIYRSDLALVALDLIGLVGSDGLGNPKSRSETFNFTPKVKDLSEMRGYWLRKNSGGSQRHLRDLIL